MSDQISFPCLQYYQPVPADTWLTLDLAKQPKLRQQLLEGQLHHLHCPLCQALMLPFAIHDSIGIRVILFIPMNYSFHSP